jgi:hypothetical protein
VERKTGFIRRAAISLNSIGQIAGHNFFALPSEASATAVPDIDAREASQDA